MYHIEKGDYVNKYQHYENNPISAFLREIPQYGEWIIGDMVVVDGNTYAYIGGSTALLMLFIKENSDRCHYYNGKWNKKDLAIGISSIILGSIAKYFITLI